MGGDEDCDIQNGLKNVLIDTGNLLTVSGALTMPGRAVVVVSYDTWKVSDSNITILYFNHDHELIQFPKGGQSGK